MVAGTQAQQGTSDVQASSRTILELTASLMEAGFRRLGEGVIMGTMPRYLEEFGRKNASYMAKKFVECDPKAGAVSALTGLNFISRVTDTPFAMESATKADALKRLQACEFQEAFAKRSEFARAMICILHLSVYRGHVNGLMEDPATDGYDVELESRILFGDDHCDFHVTSRAPRPDDPDSECPSKITPSREEMQDLSHHFYTVILVSFIDYLMEVLPAQTVEAMLMDCADEVGTSVAGLLREPELSPDNEAALDLVRAVLLIGGRELDPQADDEVRVTGCPYAHAILSTTKNHDEATARDLRAASCMMCRRMTETVARAAAPDTRLERTTCLTLGDDDCRFHLRGGGPVDGP